MSIVTINVGGTVFQTQRSTLQGVPNTRLSNDMFLQENFVTDKQYYFFDRDPLVFSYILNFYRTGELHLPSGVCSSSIKKELKFWMVPEEKVSECCWKELYQMKGETEALRQLNEMFEIEITDCIKSTQVNVMSTSKRIKHNVWMFLEYPTSSLAAKIWEVFYFTLIVLSAFIFLLDSAEQFREPNTSMIEKCNLTKTDNSTQPPPEFVEFSEVEMKYILTRPLLIPRYLDICLVLVFTVEFLARFIVCPRKCQFIKSILNMCDLIFIVCKYPLVYMEKCTCFTTPTLFMYYAVLKTITTIRLVRLFRIGRQCQGFKVMLLAIKASVNELFLMVGSFMCVTVLFAAVVYMAEVKEGTFTNAFYACWWAMITMTTVGYGDIFPITPFGRILGAMCAVTGLIVLTLPVAIIGTNFSEYYNVNRNRAMYTEERKKECSNRKDLTKKIKVEQTKVIKIKN